MFYINEGKSFFGEEESTHEEERIRDVIGCDCKFAVSGIIYLLCECYVVVAGDVAEVEQVAIESEGNCQYSEGTE